MPNCKCAFYPRIAERFAILRRFRWILLPMLAVLIFFSLFKIQKVETMADGTGTYTLPLNRIITYQNDISFAYYATELLSVDLAERTAVIRVKFPKQDWRRFTGRKGEHIGESGLFLKSLTADSITVTYGITGKVLPAKYTLRFRL